VAEKVAGERRVEERVAGERRKDRLCGIYCLDIY
jgi:hypothetical protein